MPSAKTGFPARLGLIAFGLLLFALLEAMLALFGVGGARDRGDPLLGFGREYGIFALDAAAGRYVTDPGKRESFNDQSFAGAKPPGGVRIFCLGGSATYGFPRGAEGAFPAALGRKLARAFPGRAVECVNAGGLSYASYRCVNVAREIARYDPDAIVYYGGDNEYVERRFFRKILEEPPWRRSLRGLTGRLRTATLLRRLLVRPGAAKPSGPEGDLFGVRVLREDNEALPRSDAEDRSIEENDRASLRQMAEIAREAGALFVIGAPAVNQADWPPDLSLHDPSRSAADLAACDARLAEGKRLLQSGRPDLAIAELAAAAALDPRYAETHFLLGACYHAVGDANKAREAFEAAIATDATPIRATPNIQRIAREVAAESGALLVDVPALFAAASEGGVTGSRLFIDYCHPTPEGHERIADALFAALAGPLFGAAGASPPPDSAAAPEGSSAFGIAWEGQMLLRQGRPADAEARFHAALALDPEFSYALEGLGRVAALRGDSLAALALYERALRSNPENPTILTNLGNLYLTLGRYPEAEKTLELALQADPHSASAPALLARAIAGSGRTGEARALLERAARDHPDAAEVRKLLAGLLAQSGDRAGAIARYLEARQLDPADPVTGYSVAVLLLQEGRAGEAAPILEETIRRSPTFYPAIGAAGVLAMQRGDPERARALFRRVLELRPGDPLAEQYLRALDGGGQAPGGSGR